MTASPSGRPRPLEETKKQASYVRRLAPLWVPRRWAGSVSRGSSGIQEKAVCGTAQAGKGPVQTETRRGAVLQETRKEGPRDGLALTRSSSRVQAPC